MAEITIHHGDSRDVLKTIPDCSVDSIVTDPPYALVSIGKRFGADNAAPALAGKTGAYQRASAGFMGQKWDTGETAHDVDFWSECYRVLKPGGHVATFSATRTYHRQACAIEDAGFEIRDMLQWLYGSGFPKSHDVSKGIDKAAGAVGKVVRERYTTKRIKPGATVVREGAYGKQDVPYTATDVEPATPDAAQWRGWGTALKPACEPIVLARKPLAGTVAANVLAHGTGALNIDGCRIGEREARALNRNASIGFGGSEAQGAVIDGGKGRWPANVLHDGSPEVVEAFPMSANGHWSGETPSLVGKQRQTGGEERHDAAASAARFFYTAKADATERLGTKHPTVKPTDLMMWLIRLVTPPGGTILDPFAGSGSTGVAAVFEGVNAILIEREADYVADIRRRVAWAQGDGRLTALQVKQPTAKPESKSIDMFDE